MFEKLFGDLHTLNISTKDMPTSEKKIHEI